MRSWATEELKYAALPDKRLNQRLIKIVENLAQQPLKIIRPQEQHRFNGSY